MMASRRTEKKDAAVSNSTSDESVPKVSLYAPHLEVVSFRLTNRHNTLANDLLQVCTSLAHAIEGKTSRSRPAKVHKESKQ